MKKNPFSGSTRKRRNPQPRMNPTSSNSTIVEYSALSTSLSTGATGVGVLERFYVPGYQGQLSSTYGPAIVAYYSTGKFLPGTRARWEPSVGATTSGRVYVGFTDNPEVISALITAASSPSVYLGYVKGLGDVVSFPVWQETDVQVPTRMRRKMFDTNASISNNVDVLDRSCQVYMAIAVEGPASTSFGSMWCHDKVMVEGINPIGT